MTGPVSAGVGLALALAALPIVGAAVYLALLGLLARHREPPAAATPRLRFDIVIPAHDEEQGIASTIESLLSVDYPRALYRILVVADNCRDRTAERAARAGAHVLERSDPLHRGKGYALSYAYAASLEARTADAVVVIDADSVVSPNLLSAIGTRLAAGEEAVQVRYGVRNANDSWRTRLMEVAFALTLETRALARERLGLSCGLRGNGMGFTCDLLRRVPHASYSVVEDLEYGMQLGHAGVRVAYVAEAHVLGEMPASEAASRSQRDRWESGRLALARAHIPRLLRGAFRRRDRVMLDLALELLVPPLSTIAAASAAGMVMSIVALSTGVPAEPAVWLWAASVMALVIYVVRGCALTTNGALRTILTLSCAPYYVAWKFALRLRPSRARGGEWVRTERASKS
jgi:cellulose synthase/poly-beta-1,6-N-acetylglucosamine synthase-like glycosyltransferase